MSSNLKCFAVVLLTAACTGEIGGGAGHENGTAPAATPPADQPPGATVPPGVTPEQLCGTEAPGSPARVWRLTSEQYANTIATFMSGRSQDANRDIEPYAGVVLPFSIKLFATRFSNHAEAYGIGEADLRDIISTGETIASRTVAELEGGSCLSDGSDFATCIRQLVSDKGALLFRRPLEPTEVDKYAGLATRFVGEVGSARAAQLALTALLTAPQFLFRTEVGTGSEPAVRRMTQFELASALSYSITDGPPDQKLWDDATAGRLADATVLAQHIERLLIGQAPATAFERFFSEYFGYEAGRDLNKAENFHDASRLIDETRSMVRDVLSQNSRQNLLSSIFTSPFAYVSQKTQASYGLVTATEEPTRVELDPNQRLGLLMQPSWLVAYSQAERNDPIRRGRFIREHLLCLQVPEVPIGDIPQIPEDESITLRTRLAAHTEQGACRSCHELLDPMGLPFEAFDHYGRPRTMEAGQPLDTSGSIIGSSHVDGPVVGPTELVQRLAQSADVQRCFVQHSLQYWAGRLINEGDACAVDAASRAYAESAGDYVALLASLASSDAFQLKHP